MLFETGVALELLTELLALQHRHGYVDDESLRELAGRRNVPLYRLEGLVSFYSHFRREPPAATTFQVCRDVVCCMHGGDEHAERLQAATLGKDASVERVSCLGRCDRAPAIAANDVPLASAEQAYELLGDNATRPAQESTSAPRSWKCDPYSSPDGFYATLQRLVASSIDDLPRTCIESLQQSGLRGMGGAGFPTGKKWEFVAAEAASPKYVICNADESEPGTFKDRDILAELPHLVVEGMILAGLTIGAEQGIVFIRHEYDRERQLVQQAIDDARARGILGDSVSGSGRRFDIDIFVSPGGYILGEETALLEALEDKRGEPRNKPPYPGSCGLWGRPTLINNVESFALATSIIHHGPEWWNGQGHDGRAGLKFVCISGDVNQPGVYEIPYGLPVAELIELAGGMRDGQSLQAFLPGGASSNFLSAEHVDTPLDFDAMADVGSMLGTGAAIIIADGRDLFSLATNLVRFFRNESCGKCVPCRIGSEKAVELLEDVQSGGRTSSELAILPELGETLEQTSICGLGQVALNPILSMMKHFPGEVP